MNADMSDSAETDMIQRRRHQNRLAQRRRRDAIKSQLEELGASNRELQAFKETIIQAATARSSTTPIPRRTTEAGAALSVSPDYVPAQPTAITTPPASSSPYINMDDFMASLRCVDPSLGLFDDVESNPGQMISAMDLTTYHGTPSFETSPRREREKNTKGFRPSAVEPLYDYASAESSGGNSNLDGSGNGSSNNGSRGWGPDRGSRRSTVDDGRNQALHIAVSNGHVSMVQLLVKHGADVNAPTGKMGRTSLHDAAGGTDVKMVELLLAHGADVSVQDAEGMTALQIAVSAGNIDVVEVLLRADT